MGHARIEKRVTTVLKDYAGTDRSRYFKEVTAYTDLDWATPELKWHGEFWIEVERLTPILEITPSQSKKYEKPLRDLLQAVHEAGYWHGDCDLVNVVLHPVRGPLLIDWENLSESSGEVSYDLYGASAAGIPELWETKNGEGVYWSGTSPTCPANYWRNV